MLNKLQAFLTCYNMVEPGDRVICAVSGGADSVALLFAMYLLRQKLHITVEAAHFNHHLRAEESDRDAAFVREFCERYDIVLHIGEGTVEAGSKGLEAAARDARYRFLKSLPGKIATAHTADDNAETVLMHMVRGTGLKGLGGITPVCGQLIRPMLNVTRQEVLAFLEEYHLQYVSDSSNETDLFLRNRIRHHVMPLLKKENPQLTQNLSAMALRLREDEQVLSGLVRPETDVQTLRQMPEAIRSRSLVALLESCGVPEPEAEHVSLMQKLVFSPNPSAQASFPGGITICRNYGCLEKQQTHGQLHAQTLACPGQVDFPGVRVICTPAQQLSDREDCFTVQPQGALTVRCRNTGDTICLHGGTKTLKKLFIDRKIPVSQRHLIPVITDEQGVLGICGIGADRTRLAKTLPAVEIRFEKR